MDKSKLAKHICERYGIEWDESATVPCVKGVPVTEGDVVRAFASDEAVTKASDKIILENREAYRAIANAKGENKMKEIFLEKLNEREGDLYYDQILFDGPHPMLFTCTSEQGNLFLVSRCKSDYNSTEWLVSRVPEAAVIAMLQDRITVREAFLNETQGLFLVAHAVGADKPVVREVTKEEVPQEVLPTMGEYWDADEHECDEEIEELEWRMKQKKN